VDLVRVELLRPTYLDDRRRTQRALAAALSEVST
jgi:hypothetical protein